MSKQTVTGTCDICKCKIGPSKNQGALNRAMGWHKLHAHGIKGVTTTLEGKRSAARARHWRIAGLNDRQIAEREAEFLKAHPTGASIVRKKKPGQAIHMGLDKCPKCDTYFWSSKAITGVKWALKLEYCPECNIRFYYTEQ